MLVGFPPLINLKSEILILGSMPSEESLRKNEYYGNPRNQFWRILYSLFNQEIEEHYQKRMEFVLNHKIALWDVIESCQRAGSLDSQIKGARANDFEGFYRIYPKIRMVAFNGGKASEVYRRQVGFGLNDRLNYLHLPSTSPANTMPFEEKLTKWKSILDYLSQG